MTSSSIILAKPSGQPPISLSDHIDHVRDEFLKGILPRRDFVINKYARMVGGADLTSLTLQSIQWHDEGKKDPRWQEPCRKDYAEWKGWVDGGRISNEPRGVNLQKSGIRHEMASLTSVLKSMPDCPLVIQVAIAAHHNKLSCANRHRWTDDCNGNFYHHWKRFISLSDEIDDLTEFDTAVLRRYEYAGPRALLQLADRRASALEGGKAIPELVPFRYEFPEHWKKQGPQQVISDLRDDLIALLRAPTGAGKTDAALLWARYQIYERKRADRLIIAMPTRFTANSLSISDAQTLSQRGLYHSSAWYQRLKGREKHLSVKVLDWIDAEQQMARLLETPVTVTTIDHLCISLTGTREDHHAIFFNLAHSCVVIDEADFYDPFTQANLVILLRVLRLLEVPVLLMSATLPESSRQLYSIAKIHEDASDLTRIRCQITVHEKPIVRPEDAEEWLRPAVSADQKRKPTIVYANTVQRAQRYYRWLLKEGVPQDDIILYHSRYTEPDKVDIEERLRSMLGKKTWEEGKQRGIAILTQIGELSVNISADYMLSELCPIDRLVQRVGRLARFLPFSQQIGELHLLMPFRKEKDGNVSAYPAPYGSYENGRGWVPSEFLQKTANALKNGDYSASRFILLVNDVYGQIQELDSKARLNQDKLHQLIGMNWLLSREDEVTPEADQTKDWCCRDIDPQVTVLVGLHGYDQFGEGTQWVRSRQEWSKKQLEHGITCQAYEFHRAKKKGCLDKVHFVIGSDADETITAWLVKPDFYDAKLGLCFDDPEDENE